jgi:hypothetical protein
MQNLKANAWYGNIKFIVLSDLGETNTTICICLE